MAKKEYVQPGWGQKIPLFSPEEIKRLPKHRGHKKRKEEPASQPGLLPQEPILDEFNKSAVDPEKKLYDLGSNLDSPYYRRLKKTTIKEEMSEKRTELRKRIGLPVARGKDPHVNDNFYKFLVKKVYTFDEFGIFEEYDRVLDKMPPELDGKINQVAGLINELLNTGLNRQERSKKFWQFDREYHQERKTTK